MSLLYIKLKKIMKLINSFFLLVNRKGFNNSLIYFVHYVKSFFFRKLNWLPMHYNIGICSLCNLDCKFCSRKSYGLNGFSEVKQLKRLIKQIPSFSHITIVDLGEPLLHPDLIEILNFFKKKHNIVEIFTNGSQLIPNMPELMRVCDKIRISVDSVEKEKFNLLRKNLNLTKFKKNLYEINRLKKAHAIKNCELSIAVTISKHNYRDLIQIAHFTDFVNFDSISFNLVEDWDLKGREREKVINLKNDILQQIMPTINYCKKKGLYVYGSDPDILFSEKQSFQNCQWIKNIVVINWKGDIVPCCLRRDYRLFCLGNVYGKYTLKEIMRSQKVIDFINNKATNNICKNCNWYQ